MKFRILLTALVLLAGGVAFAADKAPAYHIVYLEESRPVLVRLNIEIDGKPLAAVWTEFLDFVFKSADADKSGTLDKAEAERVPTPQAIFSGNTRFIVADVAVARVGGGSMLTAMDRNRDNQVTPDELEAYYRTSRAMAFNLQFGGADRAMQRGFIANGQAAPPSTDALNEALFKMLDTDADGKLSKAELAAAPGLLDRLDADEDEVLTTAEVVQQPPPSGYEQVVFFTEMEPQPNNSPFLAVTPGEPASTLARQLLTRYAKGDKAKAKRVNRADLSLDDKAFAALDADEDGALDTEELAHFADREPDVEINVRLGKTRKPLAIEVVKPQPAVQPGPHDPINVEIGNTRISLRVVLPPDQPADGVRQQYRQQFTNADADNNGYLEAKEVETNRFFRGTFKSMDADGDGMLFLKEMLNYLDRQEAVRSKALTSCVTLNVSNHGKGILDLMDTSKDGRLGLRELRQVVTLLKELDRNGDGGVLRTEIPRSYTLSATRGTTVPNDFRGAVVTRMGVNEPERPPAPTAGPLWFRKMDRNRDGDVSRREFLGTDDVFRTMDADGDGLVSLAEAEKVDAEHRNRARE